MKISKAICSAIAVVLLAGCSANTFSPSGSSLSATANSSGVSHSGFIPAAASPGGIDRFGGVHDARNLPLSACDVAYVSAPSPTAEDLLYTVPPSGQPPSFPVYLPLPNLPTNENGWGLWAEHKPKLILAGHSATGADTIDVYAPCMTAPLASYVTKSKGPPESITAFNGGAIFATEYRHHQIDCGVPSGGALGVCDDNLLDAPGNTVLGTPQYVAVGGSSYVYVQGDNVGGDDEVDRCPWSTPTLGPCTVCAKISGPTNPGGIVIDKNEHLIVDDDGSRTLYSYNTGAACSSTNTPIHTLPYSLCLSSMPGGPFSCVGTAITLDKAEDEIVGEYYFWSSNSTSCPSLSNPCMQASEDGYNPTFATFGSASTAATPFIMNQMSGTGIAVWPPGPY